MITIALETGAGPRPALARLAPLAAALGASLAATLAGCGGEGEGSEPSGAPAPAPALVAEPTSGSGERPAPAAPPPPGTYQVLRKVSVIDEQGFGQPIEALSLLIPADWSFAGGVQWVADLGCPANGIRVTLRAASADGRTGVESFPAHAFGWTDDPNLLAGMQGQPRSLRCDLEPPAPATEWLERSLVPSARAGARIVAREALPAVARELDREVEAAMRAAGLAGASQVRHDVARLRLERASAAGALEEWIAGTLQHTTQTMPSTSALLGYGGPQQTTSTSSLAYDVYALWAPAGELDAHERLFASIVASARPNPVWVAAVQDHLMQMSSIAAKGARDRSRILADASDHVARLQREGWESRQRSQERMAEAFSQTIRGVETYVDPVRGGEVELPGGYRDVWTNGNGEYLLSEVSDLDPSVLPATSTWTRIHVRER